MNSLIIITVYGTQQKDEMFWEQLVKDTIKYSKKELNWENLRMFFPRDNYDFELGRYITCQVKCSEMQSQKKIKQALITACVKNFLYLSELSVTFIVCDPEIIYGESKES